MNKNNILSPLFKKIDQVVFGFEDIIEIEKQQPETLESDNDEEFDAIRSTN